MLSGAEEGAQGAPFESYKLAAVRLAEAVRLASRGNDSENDLVLELSSAVNLFLRESGGMPGSRGREGMSQRPYDSSGSMWDWEWGRHE